MVKVIEIVKETLQRMGIQPNPHNLKENEDGSVVVYGSEVEVLAIEEILSLRDDVEVLTDLAFGSSQAIVFTV